MITKKRKRNPQDATRRNVQAANKRLDRQAVEIFNLNRRIGTLEVLLSNGPKRRAV